MTACRTRSPQWISCAETPSMTPTPATFATPFDFACHCLRRRLGFAGLNDRPRLSYADWPLFVQAAARKQIAPLLAALADDRDVAEAFPLEVLDFFQLLRDENETRNASFRADLTEAVRALNEIGLEPVLLKGAARLVDDSYADPAERFMADIDLLVPKAEVERAFVRLVALGYRPSEEGGRLPQEYHHLDMLLHPGDGPSIELHRAVCHWRQTRLLSEAGVRERSRPVDLDGARARLMTPVDSILHLIVHRQIQHRNVARGTVSLKDVAELVFLIGQSPSNPLPDVIDNARRNGAGLATETFLAMCEQVLRRRLLPSGHLGAFPRALARRAIWQENHPTAMQFSRVLVHLSGWLTVFYTFPSTMERFPGRLFERAFYLRRWRAFQHIRQR
ncbi:nucleotidyltransferase domain-containing protein [Marinivivus vitaminiproducens]|uniref:nucleotidyltransferase domain-containing protein n=1 Tax=Marinivivus vitaminiproducens TaxID=3035935 RepID=UPI002799B3C6|nr:nucleotidyltransferase family protein [Geminicoccaceae bacterium SCSIO 64248]